MAGMMSCSEPGYTVVLDTGGSKFVFTVRYALYDMHSHSGELHLCVPVSSIHTSAAVLVACNLDRTLIVALIKHLIHTGTCCFGLR